MRSARTFPGPEAVSPTIVQEHCAEVVLEYRTSTPFPTGTAHPPWLAQTTRSAAEDHRDRGLPLSDALLLRYRACPCPLLPDAVVAAQADAFDPNGARRHPQPSVMSSSSIVTRSSIQVIAEAVGIAALKDEVADALAPDVEYRLRDLLQEAIKFQKHGRRDVLTVEDINYAMRLRSCEPLYGFSSPDPPKFCRAATPGVFYLEDPELNLADLLSEPLPRVPVPAAPRRRRRCAGRRV